MEDEFEFPAFGPQPGVLRIVADLAAWDPHVWPCQVELEASHLRASTRVAFMAEGDRSLGAGLGRFMCDAGSGQLWSGERRWRSSDDDVRVVLGVDATGHVACRVELAPWRNHMHWSAATEFGYALGDLARIGDELAAWSSSVAAELGL